MSPVGGSGTYAEWVDVKEDFLENRIAKVGKRKSFPKRRNGVSKGQEWEIQCMEGIVSRS